MKTWLFRYQQGYVDGFLDQRASFKDKKYLPECPTSAFGFPPQTLSSPRYLTLYGETVELSACLHLTSTSGFKKKTRDSCRHWVLWPQAELGETPESWSVQINVKNAKAITVARFAFCRRLPLAPFLSLFLSLVSAHSRAVSKTSVGIAI